MPNKTEIVQACAYIDGTTGYQCVLRMCRIRGFPSKARLAYGDLQTPKGQMMPRTFYFCDPAFNFMLASREGKNPSYKALVEEQRECSYFDTEMKIKIPKKYHYGGK
jgi:hypothetical protein